MVFTEMRLGSKILIANLFAMAAIVPLQLIVYFIIKFAFQPSPVTTTVVLSTLLLMEVVLYVYIAGFVANKFGWD